MKVISIPEGPVFQYYIQVGLVDLCFVLLSSNTSFNFIFVSVIAMNVITSPYALAFLSPM